MSSMSLGSTSNSSFNSSITTSSKSRRGYGSVWRLDNEMVASWRTPLLYKRLLSMWWMRLQEIIFKFEKALEFPGLFLYCVDI